MSKHSKKIKNLNKIVAIILIVIVASIILAISDRNYIKGNYITKHSKCYITRDTKCE